MGMIAKWIPSSSNHTIIMMFRHWRRLPLSLPFLWQQSLRCASGTHTDTVTVDLLISICRHDASDLLCSDAARNPCRSELYAMPALRQRWHLIWSELHRVHFLGFRYKEILIIMSMHSILCENYTNDAWIMPVALCYNMRASEITRFSGVTVCSTWRPPIPNNDYCHRVYGRESTSFNWLKCFI